MKHKKTKEQLARNYEARRALVPRKDPMTQVADAVAKAIRERVKQSMQKHDVIAWLTHQGEINCVRCVQPTLERRSNWVEIRANTKGKADRCDLCGRVVVAQGTAVSVAAEG